MADASTTVYLLTPTGDKINGCIWGGSTAAGASGADFLSLEYTNKINDIGVTSLVVRNETLVNAGLVPENLIDHRIEITTQLTPGSPETVEGDCHWFIRKITRDISAGVVTLTAMSSLCLLDTRDAPDDGGTAYTKKTNYADNMIKEIVRENLGSSAVDIHRQLTSSFFRVAANVDLGPTITREFPGKNVLQVVQEIANATQQVGTPIFVDIVWTGTIFELRTYSGQRGTDHSLTSSSPLLVDVDWLSDVSTVADYEREATYIYAGNQYASNDAQIARSWIGRREGTASNRGSSTAARLSEAQRVLYERRYRTTFSANMIDTPQFRYGINWAWGDRLTIQDGNASAWSVHVGVRTVKIQKGKRTVTAQLRTGN